MRYADVNRTEERLTALEIKASFQDELIDKLDQVIIRQQEQIDALAREVIQLRQHSRNASDMPHSSAQDNLPPHY